MTTSRIARRAPLLLLLGAFACAVSPSRDAGGAERRAWARFACAGHDTLWDQTWVDRKAEDSRQYPERWYANAFPDPNTGERLTSGEQIGFVRRDSGTLALRGTVTPADEEDALDTLSFAWRDTTTGAFVLRWSPSDERAPADSFVGTFGCDSIAGDMWARGAARPIVLHSWFWGRQ